MPSTHSSDLGETLAKMRAFIDEEVIPAEPVLRSMTLESLVAMGRLKDEAKQQGLWALGHPEEIGGGGLSFMDVTRLNEIIGRSFFGQSAVGTWSMQDSIMLHKYANEEQRQRWLLPLVAGEIRSSVGMTEPEVAGSDPTLMQATAVLDGDEWVINAHKWFTTGANIAAFTTIFAQTEPEEAGRYKRFSAIIVPTDTPGYEVVRVIPTMGSVLGAHSRSVLPMSGCREITCWVAGARDS
jgi:alkylation response protein AidB-like acyl-CoA dehydrogenase